MPAGAHLETDQIEVLITRFIREELAGDGEPELEPDESLLTSGVVDSVGIVRLIAHIKERMDVSVPPTDLLPHNFRTIRVMAAYMHGRQKSD